MLRGSGHLKDLLLYHEVRDKEVDEAENWFVLEVSNSRAL
jgi:hypothetical protein